MNAALEPFLRASKHARTHTHTAVHCANVFKLPNSQNKPKDGMHNQLLLMLHSSVTAYTKRKLSTRVGYIYIYIYIYRV